jgi:Mn-dependent DtxR family transcriptional regulator
MNLTFDDADTLQSLATLTFAADSPVKAILSALQTAAHSLSAEELILTTGEGQTEIKAALVKMYKAGIVYTEQKDNYSLTQYGQQMAAHVENNPQAEVHNFALTSASLRTALAAFSADGVLSTVGLANNPEIVNALPTLIAEGYVTQVDAENYSLTDMGKTYRDEFIQGRHTITKGMSDSQVQTKMTDDQIMAVYNRIKIKHPEYANVYAKYESMPAFKVEFSKDVRRMLAHGTPIEVPIWSQDSCNLLQGSFKSKTMPYISSMEDAAMNVIYIMVMRVAVSSQGKKTKSQVSTFGHIFTMQEIKEARQYIAALKDIPEAKVNAIISKLEPGTILSEEDLMGIAAKLMKAEYPRVKYEGPNQNAIEKIEKEQLLPQVSQAISNKVSSAHPVIFPNDTPTRLASIVGQVLKENNVQQFNKIDGADEVPKQTLNAALVTLFQNDKNFASHEWSGIQFASHVVDGVDFSSTDFTSGDVSKTHFTNCNFSNAKFVRTDVQGTHFDHCNLTDTDFGGAIEVDTAIFTDTVGKALNLPKIYKTEINQSEIGDNGRITQFVKKQPDKNLQTFYDSKLNRFELTLAPKLLAIMKGKQASFRWSKLKALSFQAFAVLTDEQKNDLTEFVKGGQPPAWLTKDLLVQLNRDGEIKPIQSRVEQTGVEPVSIGKMMGMLSAPRTPKAPKPVQAPVKNQEDQDNEKIDAVVAQFRQYYGSGVVNPNELAPVFDSPEFADIAKIFKSSRDEQQVIAQLEQYLKTNDASPQVTDFRNKLKLFSYTSRLTDIGPQDRTHMTGYYQDKMFGVLISPNDNGVTNPDVRKMLNIIRTEREKEILPHWFNALASARIEPHIFTTSDGGEIKSKRVWIIAELQADPQQKNTDGFLKKIDPAITSQFTNSIGFFSQEEEVVKEAVAQGSVSIANLRPVAEKVLRQSLNALESYRAISKRGRQGEELYFVRTKNVRSDKLTGVAAAIQQEMVNKHSATFEELIPVAQETLLTRLTANGVLIKNGGNLVPTPVAKKMLRAYTAAEGLRSTFKHWPEAVILDTINRALQLGNVDEIWVASAADFSQARQEAGNPWNLVDVYDRAAEKFTGKADLFYPRVTVQGDASTIYAEDAPHKGPGGAYMGYHVIDLKKWKPAEAGGAQTTATSSLYTISSLRFVTSAFETFVAKYLENIEQMYPYIDVLPLEAKVESAVAMLKDNGKLPGEMLARFLAETNQLHNLHIVEPLAPYVRIIAGFAKKMDQRITRTIARTGESPKRTLQDFSKGLAEQFIPEAKRANFEQMLSDVVDAHMEDLLPESNRVYNEQQQLGMNTDTQPPAGGEEPVGPGGEEFPAEEKALPEGAEAEPLPPVKFDKPTHHEMENLKQEQIDQLLEKFQAETDPEKKEKLRRQLHEISTMAGLKFAEIGDSRRFQKGTGVYKCTNCGHKTRATGRGDHENAELCKKCYDQLEKDNADIDKQGSLKFSNYDFGGSPRNDPNEVSNKTQPNSDPLKKMVKTDNEKPEDTLPLKQLTLGAVDQEFTRRKDEPFETGRNDWFQYEPGHGEGSPILGGPGGSGEANDTADMDMKGGWYTELNLPDMDEKKKQEVTFDPGRTNLQLWTSLKFSEDVPSQNVYVIEKGSGKKGAIVGPGATPDTVLVLWDGTETPVEARKFYLTNDVNRSGFDTPPGSALKPKERPRQQDVGYRQGSLSFGFVEFRNRVMPFVRKLSKYANMDDSKLTEVLYEEYKLAQKKNLL